MDHLFTLRLQLAPRDLKRALIVVKAWDRQAPAVNPSGHAWMDLEVRHAGKVIFPRGSLYCAVNAYTSTDGNAARELALSTVGMKPGDADSEYFASYTPEQLAWAEEFGEAISMEREARYCDPEAGAVRS